MMFWFYNLACERLNDACNYLQLCLAPIWLFMKDFVLLPKKKNVEKQKKREGNVQGKKKNEIAEL
jgi:hypothetical protein